jgi:hypothetical protein
MPIGRAIPLPMEAAMDPVRQKQQVDRNYDAFVRMLASVLREHRNQFALMRDGEIVAYFDKPGEANRAGMERFDDQLYSIQEVTDEPIDLGFWSHVVTH